MAVLPRADSDLQGRLQESVQKLGLQQLVTEHKLAVSLLDLSTPGDEHYAGVNDRQMMYAASLPKIGILLAAFQAIREGKLPLTLALDASLTRMIRQSSNLDASRVIQRLGYEFIARTLSNPRYRLYDPNEGGGIWVGKAYGPSGWRRHVEFWRPEPISGEWHASDTLQVVRFFWLLSRGELVNAAYSAVMKRILSEPDTTEYFIEPLRAAGVRNIYRKSGTYGDTHCDAVLVEHEHKRYIAVAMVSDANGPTILPRLIQELHRLIM
jgi:beta-lactamase class A